MNEDTFHVPEAKAPTINTTQFVVENIRFYNKGKWIDNGIMFFNIYNDGDPKKTEKTAITIISTIKFNNLDTEKLLTLKVKNLEIQILNSWWYAHGSNPEFGLEWVSVYTMSNGTPFPERGQDFSIGFSPKPDEPILKGYIVTDTNREYFDWTKEQEIMLDGIKAKRIESKRNNKIWYNSAYAPNAIVGYVIVSKGQGTYTLTGEITTRELRKNFNQILSTFKFTQ